MAAVVRCGRVDVAKGSWRWRLMRQARNQLMGQQKCEFREFGAPCYATGLVRAMPVRQPGEVTTMLQLRPNCECCGKTLGPASEEARICSFECTFCTGCAETILKGRCPNCEGELVVRPRRPVEELLRYLASTERVLRANDCTPAV